MVYWPAAIVPLLRKPLQARRADARVIIIALDATLNTFGGVPAGHLPKIPAGALLVSSPGVEGPASPRVLLAAEETDRAERRSGNDPALPKLP